MTRPLVIVLCLGLAAPIVALAPTPPAHAAAAGSDKDVDPQLMAKVRKARSIRQRAQTLARRGLLDTALDTYQRALRAYPKFPAVYNEIGVIFVRKREYDRAILAFQEALRMNPEMTTAWGNLAEAQRRLKRYNAAIVSYQEFIKRSPEDGDAYYGLAACYAALKKEAEALWALERYAKVEPQGKHAKEVTQTTAALQKRGVKTKDPEALAGLGTGTKDPAKDPGKDPNGPEDPVVVQPTGETPPGEPGNLKAHKGDRLFAQRRYVDALAAYIAEVEQQRARSDRAPVKVSRPEADKKQPKRPAKAAPAATASKTGPVDVELLYKVGAVYAVMGNYRLAVRWWRRALAVEPDRELIVRHIGLASRKMAAKGQLALRPRPTTKGGPVEEARAAMVTGQYGVALALLEGLTDREAYYLRGEAGLRLGKLGEAEQNFRAILQQEPKNQAALGGLAEALVRQKKSAAAQKALDQWLGDRMALPEDFLVMRAEEAKSRIKAGPQADKPSDDDDDF